jgi:uncharacterized protein with beta-barrel porin domain
MLVGVLAGHCGRAYAACSPIGGGQYQCSGANNTTQTVSADDANVSTVSGFSVDTTGTGGEALHITGNGALVYTDTNQSPLTAASTALFIRSTGDDGFIPGSIAVETDGTLHGGTNGLYARNDGSGALTITATGDIAGSSTGGSPAINVANGTHVSGYLSGLTSYGIFAYNRGTDISITGAVVTGIGAINVGSGTLTITAKGDVAGVTQYGIGAYNSGNGTDLSITSASVTGIVGIGACNYGSGVLGITINGDVKGTAGFGVYAHAINDVEITVNEGSTVSGTAGVVILNGATNSLKNYGTITNLSGVSGTAIRAGTGTETVDNYGTVTGIVDLGTGTNAFNNFGTGIFNSGPTVNLGVSNQFTNAGMLSPGGARNVFTTTLIGNFVQSGSGVFAVDVDSANADRIDVSGGVSLAGVVKPTVIRLGSTTQWTILTAGTPIVKNGIAVVNTAAVRFGLIYPTPTEMDLVLLGVDFAVQGENRNEQAIGTNLNKIFAAGVPSSLQALINALGSLGSVGALANALDQLSPEVYLDTEMAALFSQLSFTNTMMTCPTRDGAAAFIKEGECMWARVSGRAFDQDSTFQTLGFDETSFQVAGGAQVALGPMWRLGGAFGYEHSNLNTDTEAKSEGDRFNGGMVVKYNPGALLIAASVSGGIGSYDIERPISFPGFHAVSRGDDDVATFDARLRAAYLFTTGVSYVKPLVDLDATWLGLDSASENGAGGASLKVRGNDETVLAATPAVELGTQWQWADGTLLRPYLRGGLTFFGNNDVELLASFDGAPAGVGPFLIATKTDDVVADVGAGLDWIEPGGAELRLFYEGRLGDLVSEQSGGIKASLPF